MLIMNSQLVGLIRLALSSKTPLKRLRLQYSEQIEYVTQPPLRTIQHYS